MLQPLTQVLRDPFTLSESMKLWTSETDHSVIGGSSGGGGGGDGQAPSATADTPRRSAGAAGVTHEVQQSAHASHMHLVQALQHHALVGGACAAKKSSERQRVRDINDENQLRAEKFCIFCMKFIRSPKRCVACGFGRVLSSNNHCMWKMPFLPGVDIERGVPA